MVADGGNLHYWWPRVSLCIIQCSFPNLGRMKGWVGLAEQEDLEVCWYDLHRELNLGCSHDSTTQYPLCYSCLILWLVITFYVLNIFRPFDLVGARKRVLLLSIFCLSEDIICLYHVTKQSESTSIISRFY